LSLYGTTNLCNTRIALLLIASIAVNLAIARSAIELPSVGQAVSFEQLLNRPVRLRPELQGKHPRIFFTDKSLEELRARARSSHRELWQRSISNVRALNVDPPAPGSPDLDRSRVQNDVAYALAQATFAYAIESDSKYLEAAKCYLMVVIRYDPWGYTYRTPNVDLPPAHLLYAVGFAYDALYDRFTPEERAAVRAKLAHQARLMYQYHKYRPNKRYSYSQNHTFIPMAGLAIAAFALMGEEPEAEEWARLARAVYDRVLLTFGTDGYYYEGFHYCVYSLHWIIRFLDALEHVTGEDLYPQMHDRFSLLKYYIAHSILPDGSNVFDFGDAGRGAAERNRPSTEALNSGYEVLYRLAAKYQDSEAQGVADWLRRGLGHTTWEDHWAFYSYDARLRAAPIDSIPTSYHFRNCDTIFWRSGWDRGATAIAFRCAPPEGHHVANLWPRIPDWRLSTGHAHPDANSFIIFSHGRYLTGDTGYTGIKLTSDHNTILVDDRGQANDGRHEVFREVPYDWLNRIRIAESWATPEHLYAKGEAASAYYPELGVTRFDRHFLYVAPDYFIIWDELSANEPRQFTWLINSDRTIDELLPALHVLRNGNVALLVQRLAPASAATTILPQMVTTQGRPGAVEKGEQEQRGEHLVVRADRREEQAEFLYFLRAIRASAIDKRPAVTALMAEARGARIKWANGDTEIVLLRHSQQSIDGLTTDGARAAAALVAGRRVAANHLA